MKKRNIALLFTITLLLTACAITDTVSQNSGYQKQLLMIYMVGSDLESETGMASRDIEEILNSDFSEEKLEVLICTGGSSYWWTEDISTEACNVYQITKGSLQPVYTMDSKNMAEPATLTEFIDYGYQNRPADDYSLILWNHGGGAVLGFGADENYNYDTLSMHEMDTALKDTTFSTDGKRFQWIGFDACMMAMIEVADVMSDYANYLIASEETEGRDGWDYSCLKTISEGTHKDGLAIATEIVKTYHNYYETNYRYAPDYTMACLDLSKTEDTISKLESLIDVMSEDLGNNGYSKIAKQRDQTKSFGKVSSDDFYDIVDLYNLSEKMEQLYPEQVTKLQSALENMVVYKETNVPDAHGLAMYFPYENKEYLKKWMEEYSKNTFSRTYVAFLESFTGTLSGEKLANWDIAETVPMANTDVPGEYYVQLTANQYANFSHAKYSIWEEDTPGNYICWINSSEVSVTDDGKISSKFQGKRFYLGDSSGKSLPCCVTELERNESYAKYAIPTVISRPGGEDGLYIEPAYIHIRVDAANPEGVVLGVYKELNADSNLFPNRNVLEIKDGDTMTPFYFAKKIVFREDGSVSPFAEWQSASGSGESFRVSGDLTVTLKEPEEKNEYCCLFSITDTQGNTYFTNPVYLEY